MAPKKAAGYKGQDQLDEFIVDRQLAWRLRLTPPVHDQAMVPAQQRARGDDPAAAQYLEQKLGQCREHRAVGPSQPRLGFVRRNTATSWRRNQYPGALRRRRSSQQRQSGSPEVRPVGRISDQDRRLPSEVAAGHRRFPKPGRPIGMALTLLVGSPIHVRRTSRRGVVES